MAAAPVAGLVPGLGAVVVAFAVAGLAWLLGSGAGGLLPFWARGLDDAHVPSASPSTGGPAADPAGAAASAAKAAAVAAATSP